MINFLLGVPGGGKSYEAVAFQVIPSLKEGRKVITNLPLNIPELEKLIPDCSKLIELRHDMVKRETVSKKWNTFHKIWDVFNFQKEYHPFQHIEDYGDEWRHPVTGTGPLYVIDECHKSLPRGNTDILVEDWFAEHRHEFADVLLITQSYGKISKSIVDSVQLVYRVKKATMLGRNDSYIRKVQDGVRGEVVNQEIRKYEPVYFKFYKSNTKSGSGSELVAKDVKSIWQHWSFRGAIAFLLVGFSIISYVIYSKFSGDDKQPEQNLLVSSDHVPFGTKPRESQANTASTQAPQSPVPPSPPVPSSSNSFFGQSSQPQKNHPLSSAQITITGRISGRYTMPDGSKQQKDFYHFQVTQGGQSGFPMTHQDIVNTGYTITALSDCSAKLTYESADFFVTCNTNAQSSVNQTLPPYLNSVSHNQPLFGSR